MIAYLPVQHILLECIKFSLTEVELPLRFIVIPVGSNELLLPNINLLQMLINMTTFE
jgi:hypothetical protein